MVGEHAFKSHKVEDLVDRVVCSHNANIPETQRATSDVSEREQQMLQPSSLGEKEAT